MRKLTICIVFISLLLQSCKSNTRKASIKNSPPDIIFILVDDMGWWDVDAYGSTFYQTPNIDELAKQGMKFTDAYASAPICSPSAIP